MRFPIRRREIIQAAILGLCSGIVGVLLFILLLNSMDSNVTSVKQDDDKVTASTDKEKKNSDIVEGTYEQFYAIQHGVFSSFEAASDFTSKYASLNTSAVVEVNDNYYVWSQVSPIKEDLKKLDEPESFVKPFKFSGKACKKNELQELPAVLKSNDKAKFNFDGKNKDKNLPDDWNTVTVALTSLSSDLSVVRMHLLAHYYSKNDCLKIEF